MQVLVYTVHDDPACQATMRQLTRNRIWYRPIHIAADEYSQEILRTRFGYQGQPPLVVAREGMRGLDHWTGHQPGQLQKLAADYLGEGPGS